MGLERRGDPFSDDERRRHPSSSWEGCQWPLCRRLGQLWELVAPLLPSNPLLSLGERFSSPNLETLVRTGAQRHRALTTSRRNLETWSDEAVHGIRSSCRPSARMRQAYLEVLLAHEDALTERCGSERASMRRRRLRLSLTTLDRREQLGDQVRPWVGVRERHSNIKRLRSLTRLFVLVIVPIR